jgi:hypothetical protein
MSQYGINYNEIEVPKEINSYSEYVDYLLDYLPRLWGKEYKKLGYLNSEIVILELGSFLFIFDYNTPAEIDYRPRVIGACGTSNPQTEREDDSRLQGWIGPTGKVFGNDWDKGHFIANSIGGKVDGFEFNVFPQNRKLNRGWSMEGKIFRGMENYCKNNPGVFCFHRPIYLDDSLTPSFLEFGILPFDEEWWVELFNNYEEE